MRRLILCLALLLPGIHALAGPAGDTWMSVLLDGRKIGNMHITRIAHDNQVVTTQSMHIVLDRAGTNVELRTREVDTESRDGQPLAFISRTSTSGIDSVIRGARRADGKFDVVSQVGGNKRVHVIDWPHGALLSEGMRRAEQRSGLSEGTRFDELAFQADSLEAVEVESTVGKRESVELPDGSQTLTRIDQVIRLPGAPTRSIVWVDADQNVEKLTLPLMGYELTMLACSQACAHAPNQSADILTHSLLRSPQALSGKELQRGVILDVSASDDGAPLQLAQTDEQQAITRGRQIELRIAPLHASDKPHREPRPTPADSQANDWLQSNAALIRRLARKAAGDARTPMQQMLNLQQFVSQYISNKNLSVGYASALEVAEKPEGDCTEHAVLLAALGRALGIPTRVVDGLAYTDRYAGVDHVFVPHAWIQAWVEDRWQSFDAALPGFDAGHIAFSYGDGDPWRFFAGMDTLGRMRINRIEAMPAGELQTGSKHNESSALRREPANAD